MKKILSLLLLFTATLHTADNATKKITFFNGTQHMCRIIAASVEYQMRIDKIASEGELDLDQERCRSFVLEVCNQEHHTKNTFGTFSVVQSRTATIMDPIPIVRLLELDQRATYTNLQVTIKRNI